jgi:drug/metabolite transporter (DMT)-like permease
VTPLTNQSRHWLGVVCGVAAGAWLGAAEAPMKLVTTGMSPFVVSLGMVSGVFLARFTLPALLKGTDYVVADVRERPHLIVWAIVAGMLWAVANALTAFAIRDVGLAVAFPLWNLNSLVGLFWGWLLFGELPVARERSTVRVVGGVVILLTGACLITWASAQLAPASSTPGRAAAGIIAALGAALLWGTMYVPYRKSYISGMNPLSFVAIFTVGELVTALALACVFGGGPREVYAQLSAARPVLFWLFLGGFCWVLGDLFQQYATKYVGIARGIPLSNTNQLWGLAWGVLVFGELQDMGTAGQAMIVAGSVLMACGALAISLAAAPEQELHAWEVAVDRECERYGLSRDRVRAAMRGEDPLAATHGTRHWWEWLIAATAVGIAVWLAAAVSPLAVPVSLTWMATLATVTLAILMGSGWLLWRRTRFS